MLGLVGRETERHDLARALDHLRAGAGSTVLIAGEPGIGKTALCEHLASEAGEAGIAVRWAQCPESPGAPPFWPWRTILPTWPSDAEAGERFELFEAVRSELSRDGATVVIVEDIHWADDASLRLLAHLGAGSRRSKVLLVATYREAEARSGGVLEEVIAALGPAALVMPVRGLGQAEVAELAESLRGAPVPPAWRSSLASHSDGNPFFVTQLLRLLDSEGRLAGPEPGAASLGVPPGVAELVRRRLAGLDSATVAVLSTAAVIGREVDLALLERVITEDVGKAVDAACEARLLEPGSSGGHFRFVHALVREVLYDDLPVLGRARMHAAVTDALEAMQATSAAHLASLAHHATAAIAVNGPRDAIRHSIAAAHEALRALGHEETIRLSEAALRLDPAPSERFELLVLLGRALFHQDDHESSTENLVEAADIAEHLGDLERAAEALLAIGSGRLLMPDHLGITARLVRTSERAAHLPGLQALLRSRIADFLAAGLNGDRAQVEPLLRSSLELAHESGDEEAIVGVTVRLLLHGCSWMSMEERRALLDDVVGRQTRLSPDTRISIQAVTVRVLLEEGRVDEALRLAEQAGRADLFSRSSVSLRLTGGIRALVALQRGQLDRAKPMIEGLLRLGPSAGRSDAQLLLLLIEQDEADAAVEIIEAMAVQPSDIGQVSLLMARSVALAESGRVDDARRALDDVGGLDLEPYAFGWGGVGMGLTALISHAAWRVGHRPTASRVIRLVESVRDRNVVMAMLPAIALGSGAHFVGLCHLTLDEPDRAIPRLQEGIEANVRMGAIPWLARGHEALAAAHLALGDGNQAVTHARRFLDVAQRNKLPASQRRAQELVTQLGAAGQQRDALEGTVTLVFTDLEDSTARTAALGDAAWQVLLDSHTSHVRALAARHDGHLVKSLGDGFMVAFPAAHLAVRFAQALREVDGGLGLRIGIHTGEAAAIEGDYVGHHVNLAARVSGAAGAGEVLVSDITRQILSSSDVAFGEPRRAELKGIPDEQLLHPVLRPELRS